MPLPPPDDRSFRFWQRWLVVASVAFGVVGLAVAVAPNAFFLAPWTRAVAETFYRGGEPADAAAFRAFVLGPLGATIAGSYGLQAAIAAVPFARRERWAWQASVGALALWFVVDSAVSLARGAPFNVWMINLAPLLVFVPPLAATRRAFDGGRIRRPARP